MRLEPGGSRAENYINLFRALSEPMRLEIVSLALAADELACTTLEDRLGVSKSTISYHIKILYHAGLIGIRKAGRCYFYTLRRDVFDDMLPGFLERFATVGSIRSPAANRNS